MNPSDEDIKRLATKLDEAYRGDLSDCPILLDARDMLLALKARAEAAAKTERSFAEYIERAEADLQYWKDRAEAAEKDAARYREALQQIAEDAFVIARAALEAKP